MFRKEAIENRKMRWRGRAILLPGIPLWLVVMFCVCFLAAFLTFVIEGTYLRRVNVSGEITSWPRPVNIYSSVQGFIVKSYVSEGQQIKKGDPVYLLDVSRSSHSGVVSDNQRHDIEQQITKVENIISSLQGSKKATLENIQKQKLQYSEALKFSTNIIRRAEEGVKLMKKNMDNYRDYQSRGLINKDQLTNHTSLYYQQQNDLLSLRSQNEQNALQLTNLESEMQTQAADFDNRIYQMELQRYDLQKERLNVDISGDVIVRATADGHVDSLSVTAGQMVNAGDSLLQIIPEAIDHYLLVAWVPNDAVPYLSVGSQVNLRYEAFPAAKFGQFAATISQISKTPASVQEMMTYPGAPKNLQGSSVPYYKVLIKPDRQKVEYDGKSISLENGMKAQSTLFLEKRRIYQWMLSPFYDMKHSATGPINE